VSVPGQTPALEEVRARFTELVAANGLLDDDVAVRVSPLTAEQAIGHPSRPGFPIVEGKEGVIEATFLGAKGHAFTDAPRAFGGTLRDVLMLPLSSNPNRAVFLAVLNAVLRSLGIIEASLHCKDEDPEKCAKALAAQVHQKWGTTMVGLVGLNPAIAEALAKVFGAENVRITDLNRENVGAVKFGVTVWDGRTQTEALVRGSRVIIVTGTTLANGTFDEIWKWINSAGAGYLIYGVTASGACELMGWPGMCPYARSG
jgi:uncharacterized protein (DUF4213/DUF364 family)